MASGNVEMRVLQPPTMWEEALALAKEQYIYAPDVVDQWLGGNFTTYPGQDIAKRSCMVIWWD